VAYCFMLLHLEAGIMKKISAISLLGFILSFGGIMNSSIRYMNVSYALNSKALMDYEDVITPKISEFLINSEHKDLIIRELKSRHEFNNSLLSTVRNTFANSREYFLSEIILWGCAGGLFLISLFFVERSRRQSV
jgi:hypothetical protein